MALTPVKNYLKTRGNGGKLSQYLSCITACITVFTVGVHVGWTGPSLRKILSSEYPFEVSNDEASYIAIISCVGHVIGGISGSFLADIIGRKRTLLAVGIPQLLSFLLISFSYHGKYLLYIARVLGGIGEGAVIAVLPVYQAEVASPNIRGGIGSLSAIIGTMGGLFINILGSFVDIRTTAIICLIFPLLHWVCFLPFPDTPYYLLMKGKTEKARESLEMLRGSKDVEKEILRLTSDVARQMSESGKYVDLFKIESNRKAFLVVTATRVFHQFTGLSALVNYCQILLEQTTDFSPALGSSLMFVTQIIMTCLTATFVDKFGRKPLLTASAGSTFLVLLTLGIYFSFKDYSSLNLSNIGWFPIPMLVLFIITFYSGVGVLTPIVAAEIYSTSIKAKAYSLGSIVFASSMMISTKFYQYTGDNFGLAVPFCSFAACTFIGTLFFHFKLPETKGKTLEDIQQALKGNEVIQKPKKSIEESKV